MVNDPIAGRRGILYPAQLPTFTRLPAPDRVSQWVRWFWIPEWDVEPGRTSRQQLVAYPACNLVVQHDVALLSGPTTRVSHRDLTGCGWAVGALLRPAAAGHLCPDRPGALTDADLPLDLPALANPVRAAMTAVTEPEARHTAATTALADWLAATLPTPTREALLANQMVDLLESDPSIRTVTQAAEALHVSPRTLQRIARTWVGLPPLALIRRRRLQEAVDAIRTEPHTDLARLAADLGYADQAHLANEMRAVVGVTATSYRRNLNEVTDAR